MDLVLKEGLLIQKVVDEVVILEPDSGDYYTLNEIGALMLESLQKGLSSSEIADTLSQKFTVETGQVEQDLQYLMIALSKCGLAHLKDA
ncbi:MAG: PqqD family protein [Paraglaciecola sp.]|uniref:PqqD family protein n=1 Tax=Paraglaciecola sp. TaxID=1920173 RepID=UPI003297085A